MIASWIPKRYRFLGLDLYKSLDRLLYEGLTVPVLVLPLKLVVISVVIFGHRDAQELSPGISAVLCCQCVSGYLHEFVYYFPDEAVLTDHGALLLAQCTCMPSQLLVF